MNAQVVSTQAISSEATSSKAVPSLQVVESIQPKVDALGQLAARHRHIEALFQQWSELENPAEKQRGFDAINTAVTVHISLLTFHFYPAVLAVLDNPAQFSRQSLIKYAHFKALLAELQQLSHADASFEAKAAYLWQCFQQHVVEEEGSVFPQIQRSTLNLVELDAMLCAAVQRLEKELCQRAEKEAGLLSVKAPVRRCSARFLRA